MINFVIKKDGTKVPFDAEKIKSALDLDNADISMSWRKYEKYTKE